MGIARIAGCWICILGISVCSGSTQHLSINKLDIYKKPALIPLHQYSLFCNEDIVFSSPEDTNYVRHQSHTNEVTLGKIGLETVGAVAGGFAFAYVASSLSPEFDDLDTWLITFPVSIAVGTALGATLVGNQLMDPNGSFIGSFALSSLGTAVACPIAFGAVLIGALSIEHDDRDDEILTWLIVAAALPVAGAVHGYNMKYTGCCGAPVRSEFDSDLHLRYNSSSFSCKIQLFTLNF